MPVNAVLDLALAGGLNPAPLADVGWQLACLETPVVTDLGTVVCDVVLFNARLGHLLVVEAKSGANIEEQQARKLAAIDPQALIIAGGITVPHVVHLRCEAMFACLSQHSARITQGVAAAGLAFPILAVGSNEVGLVDPALASDELRTALGGTILLPRPVAQIIRFDHESPGSAFDGPVRAELVAGMTKVRPSVTIRALTEMVAPHFGMYGKRAQGRLIQKVTEAARRAAGQEPDRLRFERQTGQTEARVVILRSPEQFDPRGRTQGYQAVFSARRSKRHAPHVPGQMDLFTELEQAERVTEGETGQNETDDIVGFTGGES